MEQAAKLCFKKIVSHPKRPLLVGVVGDSGSGKSYLVKLLKKQFKETGLGCNFVNHDEFLISRRDREPMKKIFYADGRFAGKSHWEVLENMFRLDEYKKVIDDMKCSRTAEYYPYARDTGEVLLTKRTINPSDINIFDTSMMIDQMDFVILVDANQDNIIERKLKRDKDVRTPVEIVEMHKKVQGYYWENRGRPESADITIDNNDFLSVAVSTRD